MEKIDHQFIISAIKTAQLLIEIASIEWKEMRNCPEVPLCLTTRSHCIMIVIN
jgi:hypothetical protein